MKLIRYQILYILLFIGCNGPSKYMDDFIRSNMKINEKTAFKIEGTNQMGYSYDINIEPEDIVGTYFPDVIMEDINGKILNTKKFVGRKTVFNKWFIKCKPCIKEMPFLNHLMKKYPNNNYLSVSPDSDQEIKEFLTKNKFSLPIIPNGKKVLQDSLCLFWGYPITLITDASNKIIYVKHGNVELDSNRIFTILDQN